MKIKHLGTSTVVVMLLATPTVFAASKGDNNGKPFQELNAIIDENRSLIDANRTDITALQSDVTDISADIVVLQDDLSDLEGRVSANEGEITDLKARVDDAEGDIDTLNTDLAQLRTDHNMDMVTINAAISAAVVRIDALETDLQALINDLNIRLADIEGDVSDNALAIDGILVDLTTVTAKALANMMAINDLQSQVDALVSRAGQHEADIIALQAQIDALDTRVTTTEGDIDTLQSYHTTVFSGVRTDVSLSDLNGWSECFSSPYGVRQDVAGTIQSNCNKANVMLACRQTGSGVLKVAAYAPRNDVFFNTGTGNTPHNANGVDWYFNSNYSMGYSHAGDGISRRSCDTATGSFPEERLCFHTNTSGAAGWRCGSTKYLNSATTYERVALHAD